MLDETPHSSSSERRLVKRKVVSQPSPSIVPSIADAIVVKERNLFFLTQADGSVPIGIRHGFGLYYNDCRYLSGYAVRLGDSRPHTLVANTPKEFMAVLQQSNEEFHSVDGTVIRKEQLGIKWKRVIDADKLTLTDTLVFRNFTLDTISFDFSFEFEATFEDVFIVRGLLRERHGIHSGPHWENGVMLFLYEGEDNLFRSVGLHFSPPPDTMEGANAGFLVTLGPQASQEVVVNITLAETPQAMKVFPAPYPTQDFSRLERAMDNSPSRKWLIQEANVETDSQTLNRTIRRSFRDLRTLESSYSGRAFFAAGVPWFATLFGRDSIIAALQTLAYNPCVAEETLQLLAELQGKKVDEWREEAPGKILHEMRYGELAHIGEIPHTPYYGSIDSTPLFLVLLARHAEWTGSLELFHELRQSIEAALGWISLHGQLDASGYLKYYCTSRRGLANQGWKDSGDGIVNADGTLAKAPIALVEAQGYVYDAWLGMADLFARAGEKSRAASLIAEAEKLKLRFNQEFWIPDKQMFAMALQDGNRQADAVGSNAGHALWSGIVDFEKAKSLADRLMKADMFSGWGIRTLAESEPRYNPLGYHLGTVWPHDNALIAAGLKRYGFHAAAMRVFEGLFKASVHFSGQRLPELFAGFSDSEYAVPVHYPVACHPQAWAAGSIPHLIQVLLGLVPEGFSNRLRVANPLLPPFLKKLEFRGLKVAKSTVDLGFYRTDRGGVAVDVLKVDGPLEVIVEPAVSQA